MICFQGDIVQLSSTLPSHRYAALTGVYAEGTAGAVDIVLEGAQQNLDHQAFRHTVLVADRGVTNWFK